MKAAPPPHSMTPVSPPSPSPPSLLPPPPFSLYHFFFFRCFSTCSHFNSFSFLSLCLIPTNYPAHHLVAYSLYVGTTQIRKKSTMYIPALCSTMPYVTRFRSHSPQFHSPSFTLLSHYLFVIHKTATRVRSLRCLALTGSNCFFSRVHATLQVTVSVCRSVGRSVGRSVCPTLLFLRF